jgi:hypothetical protein
MLRDALFDAWSAEIPVVLLSQVLPVVVSPSDSSSNVVNSTLIRFSNLTSCIGSFLSTLNVAAAHQPTAVKSKIGRVSKSFSGAT